MLGVRRLIWLRLSFYRDEGIYRFSEASSQFQRRFPAEIWKDLKYLFQSRHHTFPLHLRTRSSRRIREDPMVQKVQVRRVPPHALTSCRSRAFRQTRPLFPLNIGVVSVPVKDE